jgi:hypothetical protein
MLANHLSVYLGVVLGCLSLGASASALPGEGLSALEGRSWLGGIDVEKACQIQRGDNWHAKAIGSRCDGWACEDNTGQLGRVNMNVACVSQYTLNQAYATCSPDSLWNWSCNY